MLVDSYETCESIQKFKETGVLNYSYKNESDKSCFDHDAAYSDSKDLARRTVSGKVLNDGIMKLP